MDEDYGDLETRPYNVGMTVQAIMEHAPPSTGAPEARSAPASEPPVPYPMDVPSEEPTNPFASVPAGLGSQPKNPPPPPRRAATADAMRSEMPTLVGEPRPADLAIAGPAGFSAGAAGFSAGAANPFLAETPRNPDTAQAGPPSPPRPRAAAGAAPPASAGGALPPTAAASALAAQQVAPIVGRPFAVSPDIGDPHAAFKRGSVLKPLGIGLGAALAIAAVVYLAPGGDKTQEDQAKGADESAVIGRSLPPYRTTLQEESAEDHRAAFRKSEERAREAEEGNDASRPSGVPSEGEFKDAFKKAAQ